MEAASPFINSQHNNNDNTKSSNIHMCSSSSMEGGNKKNIWNLPEPETGSILDPFQIEDLLDFSNEDIAGPIGDDLNSLNNSGTVSNVDEATGTTTTTAAAEQHNINPKNEFPIDCGDMPELDWLSSLVEEDSFNIAGTHKNVFVGCSSPRTSSANVGGGTKRQHNNSFILDDSTSNLCKSDRFQVGSPISVLESTSATSGGRLLKDLAVPGRPRSKRMRTGVSSWKTSPTSSTPAINITNTNICNFVTTAPNCSPDTSSVSDYNTNNEQHDSGTFSLDNSLSSAEQDNVVDSRPPPHDVVVVVETHNSAIVPYSLLPPSKGKPPLLKNSSNNTGGGISSNGNAPEPRRCTHCLSQKTPQWRAGPEGPKTLCNACGVRFKSGRLFPEYRPALSPTFVSDIHSNSHRKVLEMRKNKHMQRQGEVVDDGVLIYKSSLAA